MPDLIRGQWTYATADGKLAMVIDYPFGLILPPTITAAVPMVGEMTFYSADSYRIKVEPGAKRRGLRDGTPGTA